MIIGLVGKAGSGKDTVGGMICEMDSSAVLTSFALPMKQFVQRVFAFSNEQVYGASDSRNVPDPRYPRPGKECLSPREALQTLGTEWGRALFTDVWADLGLREALELESRGKMVVFTDCRFVNEAEKIHAAGGVLWRISRVACVSSRHASEMEMDSAEMLSLIDLDIDNYFSIQDLRRDVARALDDSKAGDF